MKQEFVDQVAKTARKAAENIHTALPGEIVKFDAALGLACVQPKAKFRKPNGETLDFPVITGVPVVFPQSANVSIAWPIKPGDGCLIVFCESALDFWMYGKETDTALRFDLSNAIAIPGLSPKGRDAMQIACEEDAAVIKAGDTVLKVKAGGVFITGNLTVSGGVINLN